MELLQMDDLIENMELAEKAGKKRGQSYEFV